MGEMDRSKFNRKYACANKHIFPFGISGNMVCPDCGDTHIKPCVVRLDLANRSLMERLLGGGGKWVFSWFIDGEGSKS
jgi:hypothetical protein